MSAPGIDVIITCFNYGRFLHDAVDSVRAQTGLQEMSVRVWVVDDGSTDDTAAVAASMGTEITYLYQEHAGQAAAFNRAFTQSRGEFCALLDADDTWHPEKLVRAMDTFAKNPDLAMVQHRMRNTPDAEMKSPYGPISHTTPILSNPESFARGNVSFTGTSGLMFRGRTIRDLMPVPETFVFCADEYLYHHTALFHTIATLPYVLGRRRLHGHNWYADASLDAGRVRLHSDIRRTLDDTFESALKRTPLRMDPMFTFRMKYDTLRLQVMAASLSGSRREALRIWRGSSVIFPRSAFGAFKRFFLAVCAVSPRFYLFLQSAFFEKRPLFQRIRRRLFPDS